MKLLGVALGLGLTSAVGANLLFSSLGGAMLLVLSAAVVAFCSPRGSFTMGLWALRAPWVVLPAATLAMVAAAGFGALVSTTALGLALSYLGPAVSLGGLGFALSTLR